MYFMQTTRYREIECIMRQIPNFSPRGHGSMVLKSEMQICLKEQPPPASYTELLTRTMSSIHYEPFVKRLNRYICEGVMSELTYRNDTHKTEFEKVIARVNKNDSALLSALYLLTADFHLWNIMIQRVKRNMIDFTGIRLNGIHENGYTLYCVAKDLYLGTKHISVSDLADRELIPTKTFEIICNAMAIRRYGMQAIQYAEGKREKEQRI